MTLAFPSTAKASAGPVVVELTPLPDPWDVARRLAHLPHLLFLDSADTSHPERGRYSFVTADPLKWMQVRITNPLDFDLFAELRRVPGMFSQATIPGLPPFQGGLAGLFGYGLQHAVERLPWPSHDEFGAPDLALGVYDWVIAFDQLQQQAWLIAHDWFGSSPAQRVAQVQRALGMDKPIPEREERLLPPSAFAPQYPLPGYPHVTSNFERESYLRTVERAVEYVNAGDCFQVNLSQRLLTRATGSPLELYGRLRTCNPAPFAGYFDLGEFTIVSASPERFLRVQNGDVETRPIKGTRPRSTDPVIDQQRQTELLNSPKDRAENVMIVDLLRNDLGRVCDYGSVRVPHVCQLETYQFVHHLVSSVHGRLSSGKTPFDLLRACFPGGSITGAPKVRAMEIIAELEPTARGPYCGSLGYIGFDGTMDTNLLIRTFTAGRGWWQFPVGGGIVADSDPVREYDETLHKAEGLLRALE
jgi:para-aminobenzoate synthetase component 1